MPDEQTIRVNFGKPVPLFPLDTVVLLPQQVLPLHIFEPRYKQMVSEALDASGQIAMAVFQGGAWKQEYHGRPPIRQAVCLGHIVQHERLPDGRFNILLQGVCRARVVREIPPTNERLYRSAVLEPLGPASVDESSLVGVRDDLRELLSEGPLTQLAACDTVLEFVRNDEVPTAALLELVSFTLLSDRLRYRLLAESDPIARAGVIRGELRHMADLLRRAERQKPGDWPKGCAWN